MKRIPTESEWRSEPWCLDMPYAYEHFFGKTVKEARSLFEENAICFQEDLMYMPASCLSYYLDAYMDYLLSEQSQGDSDAASCFFGLVIARNDAIRSFDARTRERTLSVLHKLGSCQAWYEAEPEIYGSFAEKSQQAAELLTQSTA